MINSEMIYGLFLICFYEVFFGVLLRVSLGIYTIIMKIAYPHMTIKQILKGL